MAQQELRLEVDTKWVRRALWIIKPLCLLGILGCDTGARLATRLVRIRVTAK